MNEKDKEAFRNHLIEIDPQCNMMDGLDTIEKLQMNSYAAACAHKDAQFLSVLNEAIDRAESFGCSDWSIAPLVEAKKLLEEME